MRYLAKYEESILYGVKWTFLKDAILKNQIFSNKSYEYIIL